MPSARREGGTRAVEGLKLLEREPHVVRLYTQDHGGYHVDARGLLRLFTPAFPRPNPTSCQANSPQTTQTQSGPISISHPFPMSHSTNQTRPLLRW